MGIAINIFANISSENFPEIEPTFDVLTSLVLKEDDVQIQEHALTCFILLTELFYFDEEKLKTFCSETLLSNLLFIVSSTRSYGPALRILATVCRASPSLLEKLLNLGICECVSSVLSHLVVENAQTIDYSQQVYNVVTLVNELLPSLPSEVRPPLCY